MEADNHTEITIRPIGGADRADGHGGNQGAASRTGRAAAEHARAATDGSDCAPTSPTATHAARITPRRPPIGSTAAPDQATAVAATVTRIAQKGAKREPRIALEIGTKRANLTRTNVHRPLKLDQSVPTSARYFRN